MSKTKITSTNLADYLKEKRTNAGLAQGDVSEVFGYSSPQFISNWERGVSSPPIDTLKTLARLYKVPADEIFEVYLQQIASEVESNLKRKFKNS